MLRVSIQNTFPLDKTGVLDRLWHEIPMRIILIHLDIDPIDLKSIPTISKRQIILIPDAPLEWTLIPRSVLRIVQERTQTTERSSRHTMKTSIHALTIKWKKNIHPPSSSRAPSLPTTRFRRRRSPITAELQSKLPRKTRRRLPRGSAIPCRVD